jgi:hypothetical protein
MALHPFPFQVLTHGSCQTATSSRRDKPIFHVEDKPVGIVMSNKMQKLVVVVVVVVDRLFHHKCTTST